MQSAKIHDAMDMNFQFPKLQLLALIYIISSPSHPMSNPPQTAVSQMRPLLSQPSVPQSITVCFLQQLPWSPWVPALIITPVKHA